MGPAQSHGFLKAESPSRLQAEGCVMMEGSHGASLALRMEGGGCKIAPEAEKGKEREFPLQLPEGTQPC